MEGTINFHDTIRLDGRVNGIISSSNGTLIIGKSAEIEAEINVGTVIIMGKVNGPISAKDRIEAFAPAQISGNISAPVVSIEKGVQFNGNCGIKTQTTLTESNPDSDVIPTV